MAQTNTQYSYAYGYGSGGRTMAKLNKRQMIPIQLDQLTLINVLSCQYKKIRLKAISHFNIRAPETSKLDSKTVNTGLTINDI